MQRENTCTVGWCDRPQYVRGWCTLHYDRWLSGSDMNAPPRNRNLGKPCDVDGCDRKARKRKLCDMHYSRLMQTGRTGDAAPRQRATKSSLRSSGYRHVRDDAGHWRLEHRIIMEKIIGRPLRAKESVHHKNGDRQDNRPENLELWNGHHPTGARVRDQIAWAIEILESYADIPPEAL